MRAGDGHPIVDLAACYDLFEILIARAENTRRSYREAEKKAKKKAR